jgi:hypothetical protein
MKQAAILICVLSAVLATAAAAQQIPLGASKFDPPLPPPPPPPSMAIPKVPKMDELPSRNYVNAPRPSFSDRITSCLEAGAAAGLRPNARAAYSRACANRD